MSTRWTDDWDDYEPVPLGSAEAWIAAIVLWLVILLPIYWWLW
jgi:hypothetical protein